MTVCIERLRPHRVPEGETSNRRWGNEEAHSDEEQNPVQTEPHLDRSNSKDARVARGGIALSTGGKRFNLPDEKQPSRTRPSFP